MKIDSGYPNGNTGTNIWYEVFEDGYDIFLGEKATAPLYTQREPFIPVPDLGYEENAKRHAKEYSDSTIAALNRKPPFKIEEESYKQLEANVDYLLLLNE